MHSVVSSARPTVKAINYSDVSFPEAGTQHFHVREMFSLFPLFFFEAENRAYSTIHLTHTQDKEVSSSTTDDMQYSKIEGTIPGLCASHISDILFELIFS